MTPNIKSPMLRLLASVALMFLLVFVASNFFAFRRVSLWEVAFMAGIPVVWVLFLFATSRKISDFVVAGISVLIFLPLVGLLDQRPRGSTQSEVKSNLGAIRSTQVAYVAEWNKYVGNQPPTPVADRSGRKDKVAWDNTTRFSILGFAPEGRVYCSYTLEGPDYPTEAQGFTARAECDYDGDGDVSVWTVTNTNTEIVHSGGLF